MSSAWQRTVPRGDWEEDIVQRAIAQGDGQGAPEGDDLEELHSSEAQSVLFNHVPRYPHRHDNSLHTHLPSQPTQDAAGHLSGR